ncbi:transcriptional regulator, TetR family [Duganella sp. CF402]|uniref:TetR/AcrR family transcriptional regulator n=1 Tax=unclassified Duganella TaxID=2636909 RepID=UPI0008B6408E|nr:MULTISPECIES: TetR/AcrR family transcriptional regulator [unclassified Duganella]RZT11393.1 TetR family transcriptional regulator [Duganella sp. BK701]SEK66543.1 transcriptional regulator, TetR family [Duganella sp. CF402]
MAKSSTTAEDILTCAQQLIIAGGYNGFSYADIADVVGIRKASIHHHFPSKVDLATVLLSRYREAAEQGVGKLEHHIADPLEQLRAYVQYWTTCIRDASAPFCVCAMLASELPALPAEVAQEIRAHFRFLSGWLTGVLERGVQQGVIALRQTPRVEAEAFMATVHGGMLSARAYGDPDIFGVIMAPQLERFSAKS